MLTQRINKLERDEADDLNEDERQMWGNRLAAPFKRLYPQRCLVWNGSTVAGEISDRRLPRRRMVERFGRG